MRPIKRHTSAHIGTAPLEVVPLTLDQKSLQHLMSVLTDLYSNNVLAVIREYSTNAYDSHIESGNERPIEVTLPKPESLTFSVQDYGVGLSIDEIRNVYSMYGASTKRDSDDATGILGLGCKSGLAYTVSFTVDAIKDGKRTVALVTKDEFGIGCIQVLYESETTAPSGVKISIPVAAKDCESFRTNSEFFFSFWKPGSVLIDGQTPPFITDYMKGELWIDDNVVLAKSMGYEKIFRVDSTARYTSNQILNKNYIVMGQVAYPLNLDSVPGYRNSKRIIAWVNMGDVNFTPSREALIYDENTNETIKNLIEYIASNKDRVLEEKCKELNPWESYLLKSQWTSGRTNISGFYLEPRHSWSRKVGGVPLVVSESALSERVLICQKDLLYSRYDYRYTDVARKLIPVIINYPNLTMTARSKTILYSHFGGVSMAVLRQGSDISFLEGREEVYEWEDIVKQATKTSTKDETVKPSDVLYTVRFTPLKEELRTLSDLQEIEGPMVFLVKSENESTSEVRDVLDVPVLLINKKQVDKCLRNLPALMPWKDFAIQKFGTIVQSLNKQEKLEIAYRFHTKSDITMLKTCFNPKTIDSINDPVLKYAATSKEINQTKIQKLYNILRLIPLPSEKEKEIFFENLRDEIKDIENLIQLYPIVFELKTRGSYLKDETKRELVMYCNMKYNLERNK